MGEKKRILIIDDDPITLGLLERVLELEGYETILAATGKAGVAKFRQRPCDLVITDMVMPGQDGLQTILDLRLDYPDLPVVAISGGGTISKERYLTVAGYLKGVVTLAKPFSMQDFRDVVKRSLDPPESGE